jgi:hypothetical protein
MGSRSAKKFQKKFLKKFELLGNYFSQKRVFYVVKKNFGRYSSNLALSKFIFLVSINYLAAKC